MKPFHCPLFLFAGCSLAFCLTVGCNPASKTDSNVPSQSNEIPDAGTSVTEPTLNADPHQVSNASVDTGDDPEGNAPSTAEEPSQPQFRLFSWNVESEGADPEVIARQLTELNSNDHYDVFALTEVMPTDLEKYRLALGKHYNYAYSKSGRNDRLELLYNENKFELLRQFEIAEINIFNRYRAPLVIHLKARKTGVEFMVMVNHLARGKAEVRQEQATKLVEWARDQTLPVFALGDYNYDYVFSTRKGNPGFVNMMRDNIWRWVEPTELIDTNWYDNPEAPDGNDDYPGSLLDFAFVAGPAKDWKSTCSVIVRDGDFPDDETTSDHRPFELLISK